MRNSVKTILFFVLVTLLFSPSAFSEKHGPKWWAEDDVVKDLGLKQEQINKLESIFSESKKEVKDLRAQMKKHLAELETLLTASELDEKQIEAKSGNIHELSTKLLKRSISTILETRKVLTKEQFEKLKKLRPELAQLSEHKSPPKEKVKKSKEKESKPE